jgi:hypothetical protein
MQLFRGGKSSREYKKTVLCLFFLGLLSATKQLFKRKEKKYIDAYLYFKIRQLLIYKKK